MHKKGCNVESMQACLKMCHVMGSRNFLGGSGGMLPQKILKSGVCEMLLQYFEVAIYRIVKVTKYNNKIFILGLRVMLVSSI